MCELLRAASANSGVKTINAVNAESVLVVFFHIMCYCISQRKDTEFLNITLILWEKIKEVLQKRLL